MHSELVKRGLSSNLAEWEDDGRGSHVLELVGDLELNTGADDTIIPTTFQDWLRWAGAVTDLEQEAIIFHQIEVIGTPPPPGASLGTLTHYWTAYCEWQGWACESMDELRHQSQHQTDRQVIDVWMQWWEQEVGLEVV